MGVFVRGAGCLDVCVWRILDEGGVVEMGVLLHAKGLWTVMGARASYFNVS
jgi:hypothetical protein